MRLLAGGYDKEDLGFYCFLLGITALLAIGCWVTLVRGDLAMSLVTTGVFFMMCAILGYVGRILFVRRPNAGGYEDPSKYI